jgi:hypothetical protein
LAKENKRTDVRAYLGLMTPAMLAASKIQELLLVANPTPFISMRRDPRQRIVQRPMQAAVRLVKKPITTSTTKVTDMNRPILLSEWLSAERRGVKTRVSRQRQTCGRSAAGIELRHLFRQKWKERSVKREMH